MRAVNEAGEPPAPRFYMGRTAQGNYWRFRYDLPTALVAQLDALCRAEPITNDFSTPPQMVNAIHAALHQGDDNAHEYRGPAYWIPVEQITETHKRAANVVLISESNTHLLQADFAWALPLSASSGIEPILVAVEEEKAVTICFCSRRPAQATEAGLETLPAFRGKGYATMVVAAWAAEVRRRGTIPMYSTSWENLASQAVARKLQMVCYGEDWSIR